MEGKWAHVTPDWCRSCGADQTGERTDCAACAVSLGDAAVESSRIGLVYAVPGRLRVTKRLGICTHVDGETAQLHVSAKENEKTVVPVAALAAAEDVIPMSLSPATRLIYAYRQTDAVGKTKWDPNLLSARAGEVVRASTGAMRAVADEALSLGWDDIFDWTNLTDSEKTWRRAHHAAGMGHIDPLLVQLQKLPPHGYHARVGLLLPHLPAVSRSDECRALIDQWHEAGIPRADTLRRALGDDWSDGALAAAVLFPATAEDRRELWLDAHRALDEGEPQRPVSDGCPKWSAATIVARGRGGEIVGDQLPAAAPHLTRALVDDLLESGGVGSDLDVSFAEDADRRYLLARLRPHELDDAEITEVAHHIELARRYLFAADRDRLRSLPPSPGVAHYQALLDVVEGNKPDRERLRPDAVELLELASRALTALVDGGARTLPGPVADDPTLWRMFAEHARTGRLSPDADLRETRPDLANWCDLHRMVGLLWDERWRDAIAFGEKLSGMLDDEQLQDEALNLTAYAMLRTGRGEDAIALLEKAMAGNYTEALLVNLSVAASEARPDVAASHFARIVNEAPNHEMRVAALRRAVDVWRTADESSDFPADLIGPLEVVLSGDLSVEDYANFSALASSVAPQVILRLRGTPSGERDAIHRLYRAKAKLNTDTEEFYLQDFGREVVAVYREVGRPDWFNAELESLMGAVTESVFVPFGEAIVAAAFIDVIIESAPELLTRHQRFVLLPQAGAHQAAVFGQKNGWLTDEAMTKYFFLPIEEFLSERSRLDSGMAEILADNFHRTLLIAAANRADESRNASAAVYNELVQRLRWDTQNRYAVLSRMRAVLAEQEQEQEFADRAIDRLQRLGVDDDDARESLTKIINALAEWRAETVRLRANL